MATGLVWWRWGDKGGEQEEPLEHEELDFGSLLLLRFELEVRLLVVERPMVSFIRSTG